MNEALTDRNKRWQTLLCRALLILSPFLLLAAISLAIGQNAFAAKPVWSNELDLWRSLYSWREVGFAKGYSGMYEAIPAVGTLGVTGITPILLYGGFVQLFGLTESTILLANAAWISLAALVFCLLVKPKGLVALTLAGLLTLYVPAILYSVTSMTEMFDYALMLFYLAFLTRYYRKRGIGMLLLCALTLAVACAYRGVYALLTIPLALAFGDCKLSLKTVLATLVALALAALCCYLSSLITSPTMLKFTHHFLHADSLDTMWRMLLSHGKANLLEYFRATGSPAQDAFRVLYCGVGALCLLGSLFAWRREEKRVRFRFDRELFCCFGLLAVSLAFIIAFFETNDWWDFRLLAPMLWLVLGFLVIHRKPAIPLATLAACAVTIAVLLTLPREGAFVDTYRFEPQPDSERIAVAAQHITYDEDATNPFTNTVRTDIATMQVQRELHPGLGLQYGWFTTDTTGKSNWILTDQLKCAVDGYEPVYTEPKIIVLRLAEGYEVDR